MGTSCAVNLANFLLFTYEHNYLIKQLETQNYQRIKDLRYTKRYLDDIPSFNNPTFDTYKYDIYPEHMLKLDEEHSGLPIHCLDITFYFNHKHNCYATTLHSKRQDPKFKGLPFTRYPHPDSFICRAYLYNTFTTELYRFYRRNTFFSTFKDDTQELISYLYEKGYALPKLTRKLRHFVQNHLPFYTRQNAPQIVKILFEPFIKKL